MIVVNREPSIGIQQNHLILLVAVRSKTSYRGLEDQFQVICTSDCLVIAFLSHETQTAV